MTSFSAECLESTPPFVNPDQELIHRFLADGAHPIPFDANPMARALCAQLRAVDLDIGRVELAFEPDPLFIQGTGVLQGGAVTAMLDFAMAFATLALLPVGASCATTNLSTAFLRAAPRGRYSSIGQVERAGRQIAFTHARLLRHDDDTVVATATSTLVVIPRR
ncbi:MAG: PaaI family thioesterase [Dermatophilaceae bacterium]